MPSSQQNNEPLILNEMQDSGYRGLVQMLNKKQREFFYHALHLIKTSDKPFYAFLSGGGVGKSHLIKSIYQAALKYYNSRAGQEFRRGNFMQRSNFVLNNSRMGHPNKPCVHTGRMFLKAKLFHLRKDDKIMKTFIEQHM